ncbi:hypothetical protein TSAR_008356 [Trichomalopsis sarcophagae]|uniref:Uncharacterized protein n=1 Tax=Trichomalopsis sarcophagae TaxID=543379 RepID=A0A232EQN1_9HYME|nr:hypothetical protein TSAR_008356 [Trichomalopsis sarcophagae]
MVNRPLSRFLLSMPAPGLLTQQYRQPI